MSGALHPPGSAGPAAALLSPTQAQVLLDHVIYEQVLECVDVDALADLERSLVMMLEELDGIEHERARQLAGSMLDRAVLQLPDDIRRYLRAAAMLSADCALCEEEAREAARTRDGASGAPGAPGAPRRSTRLKS
jgi:hypothetical protein